MPFADPEARREYHRRYYGYVKGRRRGPDLTPRKQRSDKLNDSVRTRNRADSGRRHKYGIEPAEFDRLVLRAEGRCEVCGEVKPLYLDHDHGDGAARGLLCNRCNIRLAALDDPNWIEQARVYLN